MYKQFTVTQSALKAMLQFASTKDVRYYLNGVNVEFDANSARLIATDGHIMGCLEQTDKFYKDAPPPSETRSLIIPRETIEALSAIKLGKGLDGWIIFSEGPNGWTASLMGNTISFAPIDGMFPDWRKVVPYGELSGIGGQFNPALLARIAKAQTILDGTKVPLPTIIHNGKDGATFKAGNIEGVIMPLRTNDGPPKKLFDMAKTETPARWVSFTPIALAA